jgi:hypothetical protein
MWLVLKTLAGGIWAVLQLLMPWWFGLPSSDSPYRSRTPFPDRKPLPPKKPKAPKAA